MPLMVEVFRAVRESALTPNQRLVVLVVASLGDPRTSVIPKAHQPGISDLVEFTGLSRATVVRIVTDLDAKGWLDRPRMGPRSSAIVAAMVPAKAHTEPTKAHTEPKDDQAKAHTEPKDDHVRLTLSHAKAHSETDTVYDGPYGPKELNTAAEALFDAPPSVAPPARRDKPRQSDEDPLFVEFWSAYPRRVDKGHARTAWTKAIKNGADPTAITAGAQAFGGHCQHLRTEARYIPHPATWLNGERWTDQPDGNPTPDPTPARSSSLVDYGGRRLKPSTVEHLERSARFAAMETTPPQIEAAS